MQSFQRLKVYFNFSVEISLSPLPALVYKFWFRGKNLRIDLNLIYPNFEIRALVNKCSRTSTSYYFKKKMLKVLFKYVTVTFKYLFIMLLKNAKMPLEIKLNVKTYQGLNSKQKKP